MKKHTLLKELDDIDAEKQDFKLSLANLVSFSNVSTKKIDFLKKLSTALVKKRNNEKEEDNTLNSIGVKYNRLNNECKILFYKVKNYKELCEAFYKDKKNIGKKKLFDDIIPEFLEFAENKIENTQEFRSLVKFNNDASGLEIIKLPNTIVQYANTYKKNVQATIDAFKQKQNKNKIKIFINDFTSLLQDEIKQFLQKIKTIEARTDEDPPEETEESSELISDETFDYFLQKAKPFVNKMYKDSPMFLFVNGRFDQRAFDNSPFSQGFKKLNIEELPDKFQAFRTSINEPREMAKLTTSILKNSLNKDSLVEYTTEKKEISDYPGYTPEQKKELSDKIKDQRIDELLRILEQLAQIKTDQETATASKRQIDFSRFLKVTQKLYLQFTTKKDNYPLFYTPDTEDLEENIILTSPYKDQGYTDDLKTQFNEIKDVLIVLGQEERIIKNRFKDKNKDELTEILKDIIKLKRLRNLEIYRDITYIYDKNTLRTASKRFRPKAFKIRNIIEKMQEWSETQNMENNSYERVYLKGYADVIKLLKNKDQVTQNPSQQKDLEEQIKKIIKPFLKEKFIRKQNGKKNLRN